MNGYKPSAPRAAIGLTAAVMTAITIGTMVVLPAKLDSGSADPHTSVAAGATMAPSGAGVSSARIDARKVASREGHFTTRVREIVRHILTKERP